MKWREFSYLLGGLDHKTPLGRIATIRAENDPEALKQFSPQMRRIRSEYRSKAAKKRTPKDTASFIESMKQALISMAGGMPNDETP